jgi:hypothetical protein
MINWVPKSRHRLPEIVAAIPLRRLEPQHFIASLIVGGEELIVDTR